MRNTIPFAATVAIILVAIGGVAYAAQLDCRVGQPCNGTQRDDLIWGTNSAD
jgi:hypothetical protein